MLRMFLCLLPFAYGLDIDYFYDTSLRARDDDKICNKLERFVCKKRCEPDFSACIGNVCYCLSVMYKKDKRGNKKGKKRALRHHIAHFCPDLDTARQCIFKCMKTGKPAFCGRDHVCYCGHRYTPTDDDGQYNTREAYSQFKDLYQKYFGPNYADDYDVV